MIQLRSKLHIIDNSGGKTAICIHTYPQTKILLISIQQGEKIKRGELKKALLTTSKQGKTLADGSKIRYNINGVVILAKEGLPLASRIWGGYGTL